MQYAEATKWLYGHLDREKGVGAVAGRAPEPPSLEYFRGLLGVLGNPHAEIPTILVAGTNGKTSTARIITELLLQLGFSVGTYTSPDLHRINERIAVEGRTISDNSFAAEMDVLRKAAEGLSRPPSVFELVTAGAFDYFRRRGVDVSVMEVGLGGQWDATAVANVQQYVVTNISLDHTEYFGATLADVASSEAAILEPDRPLVIAETNDDLVQPFLDRDPSSVLRFGRDFSLIGEFLWTESGQMVGVDTPHARYDGIHLSLHGPHQAINAALALTAVEQYVGGPIARRNVETAFETVRSPGRLELLSESPVVLVDGAHNVGGMAALRDALDAEFPTAYRSFVVGFTREKDPREMLSALGITAKDRVYCCTANTPRAHSADEIADAAASLDIDETRVFRVESPEAAFRLAVANSQGYPVIATGSLYLVGEIRQLVADQPGLLST